MDKIVSSTIAFDKKEYFTSPAISVIIVIGHIINRAKARYPIFGIESPRACSKKVTKNITYDIQQVIQEKTKNIFITKASFFGNNFSAISEYDYPGLSTFSPTYIIILILLIINNNIDCIYNYKILNISLFTFTSNVFM